MYAADQIKNAKSIPLIEAFVEILYNFLLVEEFMIFIKLLFDNRLRSFFENQP